MSIIFSSKNDMPGAFNFNSQGYSNERLMTPDIIRLENEQNAIIEKLAQKYSEFKETSFVGDGTQPVVGSAQGEVPLLSEGNYRKIYSQSPVASVIVKKREFSSLKHLYNPIFMSSSEKWLYRAIKRLVQRKCFILAEYERLSKISDMLDKNFSLASILINIISEEKETDQSEAYKKLEAVIRARNPVFFTTYFVDPFDPELPDLGLGQGVFELASVSDLSTNLYIDMDGSCNFTVEDPYDILFINDEDIELAIKETVPTSTNFIKTYREKISLSIRNAQVAESELNLSRISRNKSKISFYVSSGNYPVIAEMDLTGQQLEVSNLNNIISSLGTDQSLSESEKELFKTVYNELKNYSDAVVEENKTSGNYPEDVRIDLEHVRNRMRLFYLGKYLVQPMDEVHIYIDGGIRDFSEGEFIQANGSSTGVFNNGEVSIGAGSFVTDKFDVFSTTQDSIIRQEYDNYINNSLVSGGMTFDQFKKIRLLQMSSSSGTHVFAGLVKEVNDTYNANVGKFILNVSCDTNMQWLKMSRFNKEPSLDQTQGLVYDPLTPMSFSLDSATGLPTGEIDLLPENKVLLSKNISLIPAGEKAGLIASGVQDLEVGKELIGGKSITTYQHVPGMVYKWKEGVMTSVYNLYLRNPKNLSLVDAKQLRRDIGFFWSNSAFDNLDSANIISILVTGVPYNNSTFIQSTKHAFIPNPSLDTSKDFFSTFLDFQSTNVKVHGNFIPFKTISISPKALSSATRLQLRLTGFSSELKQLRAKKADIFDRIMNFQKIGDSSEVSVLIKSLKEQESFINKRISDLQIELKEDLDPENIQNAVVQVAGDDVMFDLSGGIDDDSIKTFGDNLLYLTQRRKEDVIYNKDKNLFIVSDEYDKDYDIQAFVLQMRQSSPEMFKSSWLDVHQLCKKVAEILDFEFFMDTQGHIVFRPPQYNKTPLTVLKNMLMLYRTTGVKLISDSVLKLYVTREESLITDIVVLEWEIAMQGALLGRKIIDRGVNGGNGFEFEISKDFGLSLILNSVWDTNQGIKWSQAITQEQREKTLELVEKSNISTQLSVSGGLFSSIAQGDLQSEKLKKSDEESYNYAVNQLSILKGVPVQNFEKFDKVSIGSNKNGQITAATDKTKVINKISELISRRARLLRTLEKVMSQVNEVGEIDGDKIKARSVFSDNFYQNDLNRKFIEDDTADYIGYMSGKRFIIKDEHILSASFTEKPPETTAVTVKGGDTLLNIQEGTAIGTGYVAFGADFDMWRQYGWRTDKTYERPYFTNAELQCAPYALMLLSRQRKNVVTGNIEVIGNEYYQLGDVVYITSRRLLYYVSGITHSFSYGGKFQTKLTLTYGHPPGEYIATPLDIIGKMSVRQGSAMEYRMNRQVSNLNVLLGVVKYDDLTNNKDDEELSFLKNKFFKQNYEELVKAGTKAKIEAAGVFPNSPKVFIITYGVEDDNKIFEKRRKEIKDWLTKDGKKLIISNVEEGAEFKDSPLPSSKSDSMVPEKAVVDLHIKIPKIDAARSPLEKELLQKMQLVASQEAYSFDNSLEKVVEIKLVQVPNEGWATWEKENLK